jgi:hypothetical protein
MNDVRQTHPWPKRLALWALDNAWLIVVVLAALAVRLHWNLEIHPPGEYIYSDMRGYTRRADAMFQSLWGVREYDAFYPYGTHVMLWFLQWVGGRTSESTPEQIDQVYRFVAGVYAVYGAALAGYGYALARRASKASSIVAPIVGVLLVCYYPLISLGGYFLSEVSCSALRSSASIG